MENKWVHIKTILDGENFNIQGLNIWDFRWADTGQRIVVKDPLYNQEYTMNVYEIQNVDTKIIFAAGEFSNCVWGIYQKSLN
jgi:hypothetical protein